MSRSELVTRWVLFALAEITAIVAAGIFPWHTAGHVGDVLFAGLLAWFALPPAFWAGYAIGHLVDRIYEKRTL